MSSTLKKVRKRTSQRSSQDAPPLLHLTDLKEDQQLAADRLYAFDQSLLIGGMGSGKTAIALTAIADLIKEGVVKRVLVVAPKRVVTEVWAHAHEQWAHLRHLRVMVLTGSPTRRRVMLAAIKDSEVHIVVTGYETIVADAPHLTACVDGMLLDEISRLKRGAGPTFRACRALARECTWVAGLTGTPVSENFEALYGEVGAIDGGATFGRNRQKFLQAYFVPVDFEQKQWRVRESAIPDLMRKVAPLVHVMPEYQHELPPLTINPIYVDLPYEAMRLYRTMGRDMVLTQEDCGAEITAMNAAVLSGKLQQIAAGRVYVDDEEEGESVFIHPIKMFALLGRLAETAEQGPVMLPYWYKFQRDDLNEYTDITENGAIRAWNAGDVPRLRAHPRSCGHGLNLQYGGCRQIWLGPIWSNDLWKQTIARLWRRGQLRPVRIDVIIARGTIDEVMFARLQEKDAWDGMLREHMEELKSGR